MAFGSHLRSICQPLNMQFHYKRLCLDTVTLKCFLFLLRGVSAIQTCPAIENRRWLPDRLRRSPSNQLDQINCVRQSLQRMTMDHICCGWPAE